MRGVPSFLISALGVWFHTLGSANGGGFSVVIDRPTLFGVCYGVKNVPGPFQGTWILAIRYPGEIGRPVVHTWTWRKLGDGHVAVDWLTKTPKHDEALSEILMKDRFRIELRDWSNGMYDEARRNEIVEKKVLLDYHKIPDPVCDEGLVPDGLSITRHVIGYRDGQEVAIVVYQADDMAGIRKFHRPPLFFQWGRDLDQSYLMEENEKWLKLVSEKRPAEGRE